MAIPADLSSEVMGMTAPGVSSESIGASACRVLPGGEVPTLEPAASDSGPLWGKSAPPSLRTLPPCAPRVAIGIDSMTVGAARGGHPVRGGLALDVLEAGDTLRPTTLMLPWGPSSEFDPPSPGLGSATMMSRL